MKPSHGCVPLAVLGLAACGAGDAGRPEWTGTRDTVAGVEVVRNPAAPLLDPAAFAVTTEWTAAGAETAGEAAPLWEKPAEVRVGGGVVYVLDELAARVYVHRVADGGPVATIGRKGSGPGEVERPMGLALLDGELVVADGGAADLEAYDPTGRHVRSIRPNAIVFNARELGPDRLLLSSFQSANSPKWTILDRAGEATRLEPPAWLAEASEGVDDCSMDATSVGSILRVRCAIFHLQLVNDRGSVLREVTVDRAPELSTEAELDTFEASIRKLLAGTRMAPAAVDQMVRRERERSRIKRIYRGIRHDVEARRYWVWEQAPRDFGGGPATLHLFDEAGVYLARLAFDREWTAFDAAGGRVYVLARDPDTDLASLVTLRIDGPTRGADGPGDP